MSESVPDIPETPQLKTNLAIKVRPPEHAHQITYLHLVGIVSFARPTDSIPCSRWRTRIYRSVVALERAIREFLAAHNATGRPFVWTKSVDQILASIARFAQRTLGAHAG